MYARAVRAVPASARKAESAAVETVNRTGIPDRLKHRLENLSGHRLDNVRVRYNSPEPGKLLANAFARGHEIHVAPGQEDKLPHEAWHHVQKLQGRVAATERDPTGQALNTDPGLEREADVMGARAASASSDSGPSAAPLVAPAPAAAASLSSGPAAPAQLDPTLLRALRMGGGAMMRSGSGGGGRPPRRPFQNFGSGHYAHVPQRSYMTKPEWDALDPKDRAKFEANRIKIQAPMLCHTNVDDALEALSGQSPEPRATGFMGAIKNFFHRKPDLPATDMPADAEAMLDEDRPFGIRGRRLATAHSRYQGATAHSVLAIGRTQDGREMLGDGDHTQSKETKDLVEEAAQRLGVTPDQLPPEEVDRLGGARLFARLEPAGTISNTENDLGTSPYSSVPSKIPRYRYWPNAIDTKKASDKQ